MGALVYGIKYTVPEYVCTLLVAGGVSIFALSKVSYQFYLCFYLCTCPDSQNKDLSLSVLEPTRLHYVHFIVFSSLPTTKFQGSEEYSLVHLHEAGV